MRLRQIARQPLRQDFAQRVANAPAAVLPLGGKQGCRHVYAREEGYADRLLLAPIGGNLQDRRSRQAAVGEQQCFIKGHLAAGDARIRRHAGDLAEACQHVLAKSQRHQCGARFRHGEAEPFRDLIAQSARAHLRDRLAAAGDDEMATAHPGRSLA